MQYMIDTMGSNTKFYCFSKTKLISAMTHRTFYEEVLSIIRYNRTHSLGKYSFSLKTVTLQRRDEDIFHTG